MSWYDDDDDEQDALFVLILVLLLLGVQHDSADVEDGKSDEAKEGVLGALHVVVACGGGRIGCELVEIAVVPGGVGGKWASRCCDSEPLDHGSSFGAGDTMRVSSCRTVLRDGRRRGGDVEPKGSCKMKGRTGCISMLFLFLCLWLSG